MAFDLLHGKSAVGFIGGLLYGWLAVGGRYSFKGVVPGKLSAWPHHAAATTGSRAALVLQKSILNQTMQKSIVNHTIGI